MGKTDILQYEQINPTTRKILINSLDDMFSYGHALEMEHKDGILMLRDIEGTNPLEPKTVTNSCIWEITDERGVIQDSFFEMNDPRYDYMYIDIKETGFDLIQGLN